MAVLKGPQQGQEQDGAAQDDTPGELLEFESIAQRIAQAHHEDEADSGEQMQGRKYDRVTAKSPPSPAQVHHPESSKISGDPERKDMQKLARCTHDKKRLDARKPNDMQMSERTDVGNRMMLFQEGGDPPGNLFALGGRIDHLQDGL